MEKITYKKIFFKFFGIGFMTIGGGYAMISLIEKELCKKNKWITEKEFLEAIALAQTLPGVLAANVATFIGQKIGGKRGAFLASFASTLPAFLTIWLLYPFLTRSFQSPLMNKFYFGIQASVFSLILNSAYNLYKSSLKTTFSKSIFFTSILILLFFKINPIWIIVLGFLSGTFIFLFERRV